MPSVKLTGWRKIAAAMWSAPDSPQIFGALEQDAGPLRAYLDAARRAGHRVTPTHIVGRAVAHALAHVPEMNTRIVADRAIQRDSIDIFFITSVEHGKDLSGVKIEQTDAKSAIEVARELGEKARALKEKRDPSFAKAKRTMNLLPRPILRAALKISSFVTGDLDLDLKALGVQKSPFGSAMVTSVGMFGLPMGFTPLAWMYKVPLLVLVGEIADKPVAIDGKVEIRPMIPLAATIDHRYVDGFHISQLLRHLRAYLADPAAFEPAIPAAPSA